MMSRRLNQCGGRAALEDLVCYQEWLQWNSDTNSVVIDINKPVYQQNKLAPHICAEKNYNKDNNTAEQWTRDHFTSKWHQLNWITVQVVSQKMPLIDRSKAQANHNLDGFKEWTAWAFSGHRWHHALSQHRALVFSPLKITF